MRIRWTVVALCCFASALACSSSPPSPQFDNPEDGSTYDTDAQDSTTTPTEDSVVPDDQATPSDQVTPVEDLVVDGVCVPDCGQFECGPDGCGGTCGTCPPSTKCVAGLCLVDVGCTAGVRECAGTTSIECDTTGSGWLTIEDCADSGKGCQFGFCTGCLAQCENKSCGDDGCGGTCGTCPEGSFCGSGVCMMACSNDLCALGKACLVEDGVPGLCGGTLTFDSDMEGNPIKDDVNIEQEYLQAGIQLFSDSNDAVVMTNYYELYSESGGNSCSTRVGGYEYWTHPIFVRFLYPGPDQYQQGFVHEFSVYIGKTWPEGIIVMAFAPDVDPTSESAEPITYQFTQQNDTAFVEIKSDQPIGFAYIGLYQDENFTMDDFHFGPIQLFQ